MNSDRKPDASGLFDCGNGYKCSFIGFGGLDNGYHLAFRTLVDRDYEEPWFSLRICFLL